MQRLPRATRQEMLTRTHKVCGTCRIDKPLIDFGRSRNHGDGYKTVCKLCHNTETAQRYVNNTQGHRDRQSKRYARRRKIIESAKQQPCVDCGHMYPTAVMAFHHRDPQTKIGAVANMWNRREETLIAEIAKCDVLCSNCHILRHLGL